MTPVRAELAARPGDTVLSREAVQLVMGLVEGESLSEPGLKGYLRLVALANTGPGQDKLVLPGPRFPHGEPFALAKGVQVTAIDLLRACIPASVAAALDSVVTAPLLLAADGGRDGKKNRTAGTNSVAADGVAVVPNAADLLQRIKKRSLGNPQHRHDSAGGSGWGSILIGSGSSGYGNESDSIDGESEEKGSDGSCLAAMRHVTTVFVRLEGIDFAADFEEAQLVNSLEMLTITRSEFDLSMHLLHTHTCSPRRYSGWFRSALSCSGVT